MLFEFKKLQFSKQERDVFLKFLSDVMIIDKEIHHAESSFFFSVLKSFDISMSDFKDISFNMPLVKAISIAKKMKLEKKELLRKILIEMMECDGTILKEERKVIDVIINEIFSQSPS